MLDLSLLVIAYNKDELLRRCLSSLMLQNLSGYSLNYEVIIINMASTDFTQDIIDFYVTHHGDKVTAYTQTHLGLSEALNTAFMHARGEYIAYIEADDFADFSLYPTALHAFRAKPDMIFLDYAEPEHNTPRISSSNQNMTLGKYFLAMKLWAKIIKRSFWQQLQFSFPLDISAIDELSTISHAVLVHATESIFFVHDVFYHHFKLPELDYRLIFNRRSALEYLLNWQLQYPQDRALRCFILEWGFAQVIAFEVDLEFRSYYLHKLKQQLNLLLE